MTSNPQILADLRLIMDFDHQLELMNTYRGVPVICRARVLSIRDDMVEIETHDPALICLLEQKQTRVLGSDYFEPAVAHVASVDLLAGVAVLTNFTYQSTRLGERMIVRVEPKEPIAVTLETEGQKVQTELIDLSLSGMGVHVDYPKYSAALKPGTMVVSNIDGEPGRVVRICTYRRNGGQAWSYLVDTASGREIWEAGELFVPTQA